MLKSVIRGASILTSFIAAGVVSLTFAASAMNPFAVRTDSGDIAFSWSPDPSVKSDSYSVVTCGYVSQAMSKCNLIGTWNHDITLVGYTTVITDGQLVSGSSPVIKVTSLDAAGVMIHRENVPVPTAGDPNTDNPFDPRPLDKGCQTNVATGAFPADAIKKILDAGGYVEVFKPGAVYQTTAHLFTLDEDDELWVDLRDYEVECAVLIPVATAAH